jgi:hypothetical protein
VNIPFILWGGRYTVKVVVQTKDGTQLYHTLTLRANGRNEADRKALRLASRRFRGCGIQVSSATYEGSM